MRRALPVLGQGRDASVVYCHPECTAAPTHAGEGCLALPKLNLQFLTPHDYLLRNFNLFRLEVGVTRVVSTFASWRRGDS